VTKKFLAIDFETANVSPESACALGLVLVEDGKIKATEHFLIQPPTPYFQFTYIHGITWKDVERAENFAELWPKISPWFQDVELICAHNAGFDRRVLEACCTRFNITPPTSPYQCTVKLARETWNLYPTNLPRVCEFLGIELKHHEALSDARACATIAIQAFGMPPVTVAVP